MQIRRPTRGIQRLDDLRSWRSRKGYRGIWRFPRVLCNHSIPRACTHTGVPAKRGAPRESVSARGSRGTLLARCISQLPLGGRARAPTAIYAASVGPLGGRVGTRDRVPDSRTPATTRLLGTCRRRDAGVPLALAPNSRPISVRPSRIGGRNVRGRCLRRVSSLEAGWSG